MTGFIPHYLFKYNKITVNDWQQETHFQNFLWKILN